MAKPDWGELQKRFLLNSAATGISREEGRDAHYLNYATVRRYIKKCTVQTAEKSFSLRDQFAHLRTVCKSCR